jgi:fluoride exporter
MLTLTPWILVATGGALGALMRYAAVLAAAKLAPGFLFATMLVNILGSFLIGLVMARLTTLYAEPLKLFLAVGVLGGFTTFSAFSWEALQMLQRGQLVMAAVYVLGSVGLSLIAVYAGFVLGR